MNITADTNIVFAWCGLVAVTAGILLRVPFQRTIIWWGNQIPKTHIWREVSTNREVRDATRWEIIQHYHPAWDMDWLAVVFSMVFSWALACVILFAGFYGISVFFRSATAHPCELLLAGIAMLANLGLFGFARWVDKFVEELDKLVIHLTRVRTTRAFPINVGQTGGWLPVWLLLLRQWSFERIFPLVGSIVGLLFTINLAIIPSHPFPIFLPILKYVFLTISLFVPSLVTLLWLALLGYMYSEPFMKKFGELLQRRKTDSADVSQEHDIPESEDILLSKSDWTVANSQACPTSQPSGNSGEIDSKTKDWQRCPTCSAIFPKTDVRCPSCGVYKKRN